MRLILPALALSTLLPACITRQPIHYVPYDPADTLRYEQKYCSIVQLPDTFIMKVIWNCPASADCGGIATAANCVGLYNTDTIRVIDMCNTDTSFHSGQQVLVTAAKRPSLYLSVANCYLYSKGRQDSFPFQVRLKTVYGQLDHVNLEK